MTTSTSKNSKLYSFLKGYETCAFTGSELGTVVQSVHELVEDEIRVQLPDLHDERVKINSILSNIEKYFIAFYKRMRNVNNHAKVKTIAENSKYDQKILDQLVSDLMNTECSLSAIAFMALGQKSVPMDLCEKCPWYCRSTFCMIYLSDYIDDAIIEVYRFKQPESRYLALSIIKMAHLIVSTSSVEISRLFEVYSLFTNILTCSHIYELMNPSGETREEYLLDALNQLKAEPISYTSDDYQKYDKLLTSVFEDIQNGRGVYIRDIAYAIRKTRNSLSIPFDNDKDYYYSMKGTGQSGLTKERYSLQSSAFEVDIHKDIDCVKEFDNYIGYHSYYKEHDGSPIISVRTLGINNPGKFKPRIIHIADNPLQDRCNWIHRRLMNLVRNIKSDCTLDHEKGRLFLKELTSDWYLSPYEEKIGIYCTDFSNATDTIDQRFTHRVLSFIFGNDIIANFWDYVSTIDKEFSHANGKKEIYCQKTGQPQGVLASFLVFALCHHFIFLMDMKENGLENRNSFDFYTVLGDDAVYNSILPESRFIDEEFSLYDDDGIRRSEIEISHFEKCSIFAGLHINYDKSVSAHQWSHEAKLDFAKVTYRNGKLFSPVPFRLAMKYSLSFDNKLAVCIWRADRLDPKHQDLLDVCLSYLPEEVRSDYEDLIRCGELPFLYSFRDARDYSEQYIARVRYALFVSLLSAGLSFTILGDNPRSNSAFDIFDAAMDTIFTAGQQLRIDNIHPNHKVMVLMEKNAEIIQALHEIYGHNDFDDQFLSMCLASFLGDQDEELLWAIYDIAKFQRKLDLAKSNPEVTREILEENFPTVFPLIDIKRDVTHLSNLFMTRGITKRPGESSYLFRKTFDLLTSLHQQLDSSFGIDPQDNLSALDLVRGDPSLSNEEGGGDSA